MAAETSANCKDIKKGMVMHGVSGEIISLLYGDPIDLGNDRPKTFTQEQVAACIAALREAPFDPKDLASAFEKKRTVTVYTPEMIRDLALRAAMEYNNRAIAENEQLVQHVDKMQEAVKRIKNNLTLIEIGAVVGLGITAIAAFRLAIQP
jgi:hypothetical protein